MRLKIPEHSGITDLRIARTANGEIAVKPDIERYTSNRPHSPSPADLLRSMKAAEDVIDVVLKRPWLMWKRWQWRAQHQYYIEQLVNVGRIGLFEDNIELAKQNLTSLQGGFVSQRAEAVKKTAMFAASVFGRYCGS